MEFMLSEALPIYSGGLGNVAGDQLKAASDLGVPVVGVGLLYQQGYFRQVIDQDGAQQALFPYNDPGQLPITRCGTRTASGCGCSSTCRAIRLAARLAGAGRPAEALPAGQQRPGQLSGVPRHHQRALRRRAGAAPEAGDGAGHRRLAAARRAGDRARSLPSERRPCGLRGAGARAQLHAGDRAVLRRRAGRDAGGQSLHHPHGRRRRLRSFRAGAGRALPGRLCRAEARHSLHDLLALGRQNPDDAAEPFNMAYLAIRGSGAVNGVSRLHGEVSRRLFAPLFPRWPGRSARRPRHQRRPHADLGLGGGRCALDEACGKDRWLGTTETLEQDIRRVSDASLWQLRNAARTALVDYARERLSRQLAASGAPPEAVEGAKHLFDPNTLTLGFARRFATYKRPNLLLHDPERLLRLLTNPQRPVQLIIAGKAHPAGLAGQADDPAMDSLHPPARGARHVIFLSDYDMLLTEHLVQGVDVWINTPRRPWEACGTSGMKVLVNGGLNLSELDGWWAEAYTPEVGWALGDGQEHGDDPAWDAAEAEALYELLEARGDPGVL